MMLNLWNECCHFANLPVYMCVFHFHSYHQLIRYAANFSNIPYNNIRFYVSLLHPTFHVPFYEFLKVLSAFSHAFKL